ncbi:T9SS type A sorting domain-containing protein, partial [candidate division KSB1 bacterium]|nr:T9SS type A sorting domain-containing protein [candidate division KSB1 bacterium]
VGVEGAKGYALYQNYPNPFNPETKISFEVGEATDVEIELIDVQGRRVASIAEGRYESGSHEVLFNASELSSGIYFYRLRTAAFEQIRKLAVIK